MGDGVGAGVLVGVGVGPEVENVTSFEEGIFVALTIIGGGRKEIGRTVGQILHGRRRRVSDVYRLGIGVGGHAIVDTIPGEIWFGIRVPAEGYGGTFSAGNHYRAKNKRGLKRFLKGDENVIDNMEIIALSMPPETD